MPTMIFFAQANMVMFGVCLASYIYDGDSIRWYGWLCLGMGVLCLIVDLNKKGEK